MVATHTLTALANTVRRSHSPSDDCEEDWSGEEQPQAPENALRGLLKLSKRPDSYRMTCALMVELLASSDSTELSQTFLLQQLASLVESSSVFQLNDVNWEQVAPCVLSLALNDKKAVSLVSLVLSNLVKNSDSQTRERILSEYLSLFYLGRALPYAPDFLVFTPYLPFSEVWTAENASLLPLMVPFLIPASVEALQSTLSSELADRFLNISLAFYSFAESMEETVALLLTSVQSRLLSSVINKMSAHVALQKPIESILALPDVASQRAKSYQTELTLSVTKALCIRGDKRCWAVLPRLCAILTDSAVPSSIQSQVINGLGSVLETSFESENAFVIRVSYFSLERDETDWFVGFVQTAILL